MSILWFDFHSLLSSLLNRESYGTPNYRAEYEEESVQYDASAPRRVSQQWEVNWLCKREREGSKVYAGKPDVPSDGDVD